MHYKSFMLSPGLLDESFSPFFWVVAGKSGVQQNFMMNYTDTSLSTVTQTDARYTSQLLVQTSRRNAKNIVSGTVNNSNPVQKARTQVWYSQHAINHHHAFIKKNCFHAINLTQPSNRYVLPPKTFSRKTLPPLRQPRIPVCTGQRCPPHCPYSPGSK